MFTSNFHNITISVTGKDRVPTYLQKSRQRKHFIHTHTHTHTHTHGFYWGFFPLSIAAETSCGQEAEVISREATWKKNGASW